MSEARVERRLAAILAADVAGYSRLMGADEEGTLARLRAIRRELGDPKIAEHRGRIVKTTGDGLLVEFHSVVDAVRCAVEVQQAMAERNAGTPPDQRIDFRIGINLGDIIIEDGDIFGDGVNIAARLEGIAEAGGIFVSSVVREQVGNRLGLGFDDLGEQSLKNIARPVRVYRVGPRASRPLLSAPLAVETPAVQSASLSLPDRPSLAVLPFQNMSGDPEQEYFADGMVEEITTALSRIGWFFVVARNSSFTYKGKTVDIKQVGRELGVRYVLEGSIRKAANRVRITGQLIEAATGHHVWADRFEGALDDIFDLQDRITESVVGAIAPSLRRAEIARAYAKPTANLGAYDLYLRALERFYTQLRPANEAAADLLRQAIAIDPDYALAKALLSTLYVWRDAAGWGNPEEVDLAVAQARSALSESRDDPDTLRFAAHTLSHFAHDYDLALAALIRAHKINPNSAQVLIITGWVHIHRDEPDLAVKSFKEAIRISPLDQEMGLILWGVAMAHLLGGRNEEALLYAEAAAKETPHWSSIYRCLTLAYVRLGRMDDARAAANRVLEIDPSYRVSKVSTPFRNRVFTEELREALRRAGIPEG